MLNLFNTFKQCKTFIIKCLRSKKLKEELSKVDINYNVGLILDNEFIFQMIFILNNFNFRHIKSLVNRTEKYRKDKEKRY